jgi:heme exporter protein A
LPTTTRFAPLGVEARGLGCVRGGRRVFSGVSFRAESGEVVAVTGPNGSGKSSLIRIVAGLLRPDAGDLRFEWTGEQPLIHYFGHADALKPALTLGETLRFWAALYGGLAGSGIESAAALVGLGHALDLPVGVLSAGQRRRAGLARLLVSPRPLWLLDEPSAALDADGEEMLTGLLQAHCARGGIVVAATHQALPMTPNAVVDLAA